MTLIKYPDTRPCIDCHGPRSQGSVARCTLCHHVYQQRNRADVTRTCLDCGQVDVFTHYSPLMTSKLATHCTPCARRRLMEARRADIDEVAVERLVTGQSAPLFSTTLGERLAATRALREQRYSAAKIAEHIGVTERSVWRYIGMLGAW